MVDKDLMSARGTGLDVIEPVDAGENCHAMPNASRKLML